MTAAIVMRPELGQTIEQRLARAPWELWGGLVEVWVAWPTGHCIRTASPRQVSSWYSVASPT